jgi:hypothetical protein
MFPIPQKTFVEKGEEGREREIARIFKDKKCVDTCQFV